MDEVAYIRARKNKGATVTFHHDALGNHWAVIKSGWIFQKRKRVDLQRGQFFALTSRSQAAKSSMPQRGSE
jgi:hypothetical protein